MPRIPRRWFCKGLLATGGAALALPSAFGAGPAWAASSATAPIQFVASDDYVPFSYVEDGKLQGLTVQSVRLVAARAGLTFAFQGMPWARAQQLIKTGARDSCLAYPTDERRAYLNFIEEPVIADHAGVVHRAGDARIRPSLGIADLGALRLGTFIGSSWPQSLFPNNKLTTTGNQDAVVRMIAAGRLDAYIDSEAVARDKIRRGNFPAALAFTRIDALPVAKFCFGLRKDYPGGAAVLAAFAKARAEAEHAGDFTRLQARFGGVGS